MKRQILYDPSYKRYLEESNLERQKVEWQLPGAKVKGNRKLFSGYRVSVWEEEKVLEMDDSGGCTTM